jgi:hypothetical protein
MTDAPLATLWRVLGARNTFSATRISSESNQVKEEHSHAEIWSLVSSPFVLRCACEIREREAFPGTAGTLACIGEGVRANEQERVVKALLIQFVEILT